MLKHKEHISGRLDSIDANLAALSETVQRLEKGILEAISTEHFRLLVSCLLELVDNRGVAKPEESVLEPLLDKLEVMEYLGIKDTAYYRWVKQGKLKPRGGKGQHKYYLSDIKALMEQRKYRKRG